MRTGKHKNNRPMKKHKKGDCNEASAGKGDRVRMVNRDSYDSNYDKINWGLKQETANV